MLRLRLVCLDDITTRRKQRTAAWTLLVKETVVIVGYNMLLPEKEDFCFGSAEVRNVLNSLSLS
jgi:hypothetical protein